MSTKDHTNQAVEEIRQYLETERTPDEKVHFCLAAGQRSEKRGDYAAAQACYSQAFSLTPGKNDVWFFIHNNLGFCLNQLDRYEDAEAYCRQAIDIAPNRHDAYKNLGVSRQGQGEYIEAANLYLRAAEIAPSDPMALRHLEALIQDHANVREHVEWLNRIRSRPRPLCANCRSTDNLVPIVWGLQQEPVPPTNDLFVYGGCICTGERWFCKKCEWMG